MNKYKLKYPSNFYTITYEHFVQEPEKYLKEICGFIDLPYDKSMIDFYLSKDEYISSQPNIKYDFHHKSLFNPINNGRIGKWKEYLKGPELDAIEFIAGKTGEIYGYSYNQKKLSIRAFLIVIKGYIQYLIVFLFRKLLFSIPLKKRQNTLRKIAGTKPLMKLYRILVPRK